MVHRHLHLPLEERTRIITNLHHYHNLPTTASLGVLNSSLGIPPTQQHAYWIPTLTRKKKNHSFTSVGVACSRVLLRNNKTMT
ncbi:hypothetical protein CHARACLAT_019566 [Characodon lateralis]|uniref:Uncharacterized protein n=1 Tax=Characodon lateralis TaxID=208331 RepID=A0ABU7DI25_9TELE|nr:hypothetical protein [Characodon lateralis]